MHSRALVSLFLAVIIVAPTTLGVPLSDTIHSMVIRQACLFSLLKNKTARLCVQSYYRSPYE